MQRLEVSGAVQPIYGSHDPCETHIWVVRHQTVNQTTRASFRTLSNLLPINVYYKTAQTFKDLWLYSSLMNFTETDLNTASEN